jgi:hypothetical protein
MWQTKHARAVYFEKLNWAAARRQALLHGTWWAQGQYRPVMIMAVRHLVEQAKAIRLERFVR